MSRPQPRPSPIRLRPIGDRAFELIPTTAEEELLPDIEEGLELLAEGDIEGATEALRHVLGECRDSIRLHAALGRLALLHRKDPALARGHFGYAYELIERAIPRNFEGILPPDRPTNRPLYEAMAGLAACYDALRMPKEAAALRATARRWGGS